MRKVLMLVVAIMIVIPSISNAEIENQTITFMNPSIDITATSFKKTAGFEDRIYFLCGGKKDKDTGIIIINLFRNTPILITDSVQLILDGEKTKPMPLAIISGFGDKKEYFSISLFTVSKEVTEKIKTTNQVNIIINRENEKNNDKVVIPKEILGEWKQIINKKDIEVKK